MLIKNIKSTFEDFDIKSNPGVKLRAVVIFSCNVIAKSLYYQKNCRFWLSLNKRVRVNEIL